MPVDMIHTTIGVAYLLAWVLIGQVSIRRSSTQAETVSRTP